MPSVEARARIVELRATGLGWTAVAYRLNAEQVPTSSGRGRWNRSTARRHVEPERWAQYMRTYRADGRDRYAGR